jgi:hypothetical protein
MTVATVSDCAHRSCVPDCDDVTIPGETLAPYCDALRKCCPELDPVEVEGCKNTSETDDNVTCSAELDFDAKPCVDPTQKHRACVVAWEGQCDVLFELPEADEDAECVTRPGIPSDSCPTTGLVGCCTNPGVTETCFYANAQPPMTQADCANHHESWSSLPQ